MKIGWIKGCNPNPFFDVDWYRRQYKVSGNPLVDYIRWRGRRRPHPLFDNAYYFETHKDVAKKGLDALLHFLHFGRNERRDPHPLFDSHWYDENYVEAAGDPFAHYLKNGCDRKYDPHPLFSTEWYRVNNPEIIGSNTLPLVHFVEQGAAKGRDPHPLFSAEWYLRRYSDVARAGVNPLVHYLRFGAKERRDPHPHFQTQFYVSAYGDVGAASANPLVHFIRYGMAEGRKPNMLFHPAWYARRYGALLRGEPAFLHFVKKGRFANLQPGPFFSPKAYRARYSPQGLAAADPTGALLDHIRAAPHAERFDLGRRLADVLRLEPRSGPADRIGFLERLAPFQRGAPARVGVHLHLFYPEMISTFLEALGKIPMRFDLFVSIANASGKRKVERAFAKVPAVARVQVRAVPNRGRDIAPFVVSFGEELQNYDFILHLHSKRSPHDSDLSGWLDYLLENLIGSADNTRAIIGSFDARPKLGMLYPATYEPVQRFMHRGANGDAMNLLLSRMEANIHEIDPLLFSTFPSGSMLWMRGTVMKRINALRLSYDDFPLEEGQCDGTIAHAIERLFPLFALEEEQDADLFVRGDGLFDPWCGAWSAPERFSADVVIVDHNIGGGSNAFSNLLVRDYNEMSRSVLRVYFNQTTGRVSFELSTREQKRFFVAPEGESLAKALARVRTKEIVVNSLYGFDGAAGGIIAVIEAAKRDNGARVQLMVHDFLLACPSQHLLDWKQDYCGLPEPSSDYCRRCCAQNENIGPEWRRLYSLSTWRFQSQALLSLCNEVRFFNPSGMEILSKALVVPPEAQAVVPHKSPVSLRPVARKSDGPMVIGVLGSLQYAKGITVVDRLAKYLRSSGKRDKIVVIGAAYGSLDADVAIHGPYRVEDLPAILEEQGVNVVFVSSIVPETFCFTLSEAMAMEVPVLGYDLGAQGARLKEYHLGSVIPVETPMPKIYAALAETARLRAS